MNNIKILHLIKSLGRGGAEMLLPETLRVHDRERFSFAYMYFLPHKDQLVAMLAEQDAPVDCIPAGGSAGMLARVPAVRRYVRLHGIDLIHCHLPVAGVVGRIAGRWAGVPVVYTEHNTQESYHPVTRWLNLRTMAWSERVLAVSDNVAESLYRHLPARDRGRVQSLLNGVNTARFDPAGYDRTAVRRQLGLPPNAYVVGTVCVFRYQKRLLYWLELAAAVAAQVPQAYFVLVGDGPLQTEVEQRTAELGLTDRLLLPGRLEEVRPYLAALDVYLISSEFEGLPIAMLEAMSMCLPVVSTRAGGIGEVVRDGREGYVVPIADWEQLRTPLLTLAAEPALRSLLGQAARRRVQKAFSIQQMARELEAVYSKVLTETKHPQ